MNEVTIAFLEYVVLPLLILAGAVASILVYGLCMEIRYWRSLGHHSEQKEEDKNQQPENNPDAASEIDEISDA